MQVLNLTIKPGNVLIPVSMVAQIIGREGFADFDGTLPCVRNSIAWRDYTIPLVDSQALWGDGEGGEFIARSVVLWPMKGSGPGDMIALSSLESPRVLNIASDSVILNSEKEQGEKQGGEQDYILGRMRVESGMGIIPDLIKLSASIYAQ